MAPLRLINSIQHWPEEETQRKGPPHSVMDIMVSPAAPNTPTIPRGANREGKREAGFAYRPNTTSFVHPLG